MSAFWLIYKEISKYRFLHAVYFNKSQILNLDINVTIMNQYDVIKGQNEIIYLICQQFGLYMMKFQN